MEIKTTMVRFSIPNEWKEHRTQDSQLLVLGEKKERYWLPLTKFNEEVGDTHTQIVMAKWLYMKSPLPCYVEAEEFVITNQYN